VVGSVTLHLTSARAGTPLNDRWKGVPSASVQGSARDG
jgi:hypothetical protein